ncbi:MAG: hypothetical protein RL732_150 [Bacteroidota bacterium]
MSKVTISLPQGTRDFNAEMVWKRHYITQTIRSVFELYGFQPLETPAMENLETLLGKYGEEGDKLIFKILNNGLQEASKKEKAREALEKVLEGKSDSGLTERALKYDLTIPFARYVAQNHQQLGFPFKRYQIQPVWRADRPQKGRYREFWQCDADVVGSTSLLYEAELANIYHEVFTRLKIHGYSLRINSRKILTGLAESCGGAEHLVPITVAIDKLDKVGIEKVNEELRSRGLSEAQVKKINAYLQINGSNAQQLEAVKELLNDSKNGLAGVAELETLLGSGYLQEDLRIQVDVTLARGLNYYTGIIYEAKAPEQVSIGSIGGGGRYDDLTGLFGVPGIPGVGISFGLDRIYDVMESLNLFPPSIDSSSKVLFFHAGTAESQVSYQLLQQLRNKGIPAEIYPEPVKFDKQFKYAEKRKIPFVIIIGSRELETRCFIRKDLRSGNQETHPMDSIGQLNWV